MEVSIAPELQGSVCLGVIQADGLTVAAAHEELEAEFTGLEATLRERYAGVEPGRIPGLRAVREMFRRARMDPTKVRPSSEALLRRVLRGETVAGSNTAVDLNNLGSLEQLLPMGIYDLDRVQPPLVLRLGGEHESYPGIGKDAVSLAGRLTLVDEAGPFGSPVADSARAMVRLASRRVLQVVYAPGSFPVEGLSAILDTICARLVRYTGATIQYYGIHAR